MRKLFFAAALAGLAVTGWNPSPAEACGGFFCGQQPVDQTAERIVFSVNPDGTTTMIVQISYAGSAADFAWVLPLGEVPAVESLDTFPQLALTGLDAQTGPSFQWPEDCYGYLAEADASGPPRAGAGGSEGGVTVHIRETVGPFDVAVIESTDPSALVTWLRDNSFRVTPAMEPYIGIYTAEGMKFLALRLQPGAEVTDIEPFRFTLPGTSPSVPLRMTALAAEPEMGIAVWVLGDMRYGPGNVPDLDIDDSNIVWRPYTWPMETNWTSLVARAADAAGGQGFVTEYAGSTASYVELLRASTPTDPEQQRATEALLALMENQPYVTRMYTRLSPEEMRVDPVFRRHAGGDVERTRVLPRYVDGRDLCMEPDWTTGGAPVDATTPCDFASCGAGGLCRVATVEGEWVAGCACVPGAVARTTFDPSGRPTVACQDARLSFINPGDVDERDGSFLPDPCVGFDCGLGTCVAMNMTPTCQCAMGAVAVGSIDPVAGRQTRCVMPEREVPADFYERRLPGLAEGLPGGRPVDVLPPMTSVLSPAGGGCSVAPGESAYAGAIPLALALLALVRRRRRG